MSASLLINRLRLSHFRSHLAADLSPDGRPVAIFGPNGTGKTNLIEAVSLISPGRGLRRAVPADISRMPERIGWKVFAGVAGPDGQCDVETWSEGTGRQVRIDGKACSQVSLARIARVLWLTPSMDRIWMEAAGERRRFLDRITLSLLPDHAEVALGYDRALRERNRLLRDEVRDAGWYTSLEDRMADYGSRLTGNRLHALNLIATAPASADFPKADLALDSGAPAARVDLAQALAEGRSRDFAAGRSLTGPHRDDLAAIYRAKGMEARLCSTGEQKALLVSVVLANARAVAHDFGAPPLLLLDEVAAHLDADRRLALFDAVCALGAQAWMTGTGAGLFSGLGDRAEWLQVNETDGVSRVDPGHPP